MSDIAATINKIALMAVPMLLAVTFHEVAHGYAAWRLGDPTAKSRGRLTLNPLRHLDVTGTAVFVLTALTSPFVIGWAKPVPVDMRYFKHPLRGMMYTSMAGPGTNFVLAVACTLLLKILLQFMDPNLPVTEQYLLRPLALMCFYGLQINLVLGFFNLIPLPPLDGSKILTGLLPVRLALPILKFERYGMLLVIILLMTGLLGRIIVPAFSSALEFLINTFAVPVPALLALLDSLA